MGKLVALQSSQGFVQKKKQVRGLAGCRREVGVLCPFRAARRPLNSSPFHFPEEKPRADPVLKSPSPALRLEPSGEERKDQPCLVMETLPSTETPLELPLAAALPAPVSVVAAALPPGQLTLATGSEDGCALAPLVQEAAPLPDAVPCMEVLTCSPTDLADVDACRELPRLGPADLQVTAGTNLPSELNGISERGAGTGSDLGDVDREEATLLATESDSSETSEVEGAATPSSAAAAAPSAARSPVPPSPPLSLAATATSPSPPPPALALPAAPPAPQGALEGEVAARTALSDASQEALESKEGEADVQPQESTQESTESQALNSRAGPGPGKHSWGNSCP